MAVKYKLINMPARCKRCLKRQAVSDYCIPCRYEMQDAKGKKK